jgi:hypothetical protein
MKVGLVLALFGIIAGCAGAAPRREAEHWDDTPPATTTSDAVDAGVDAGDVDAGTAPAPGLALFRRSCTPCHTRSGSTDPYAVRGGVFFETDADFRRWAAADSIGSTEDSLASIIALRADGLDLVVGRERLPMPPRGSTYAPWTPEEARTALTWLRAQR